MKPGGGGRFKKFVAEKRSEGMSEERAKGIAAAAGRKKYGRKKFARMAAQGRKRAKRG
jgi:hypothetical protein